MSQSFINYQNQIPYQTPQFSIVQNQINTDQLLALRTNSGIVTCPYCNQTGLTIATTSCNVWSCLFCFSSPICYLCYVCRYNRPLSCKDAEHKCSNCGKVLHYYKDVC